LIDDGVFGDFRGAHVKLIFAIVQFRNLLKRRKSDQALLSGCRDGNENEFELGNLLIDDRFL